MSYYVIAEDGSRYGPADIQQLSQWVTEGRVSASTVLEDETTGQKVAASSVLELAFTPAAASSGMPPMQQAAPPSNQPFQSSVPYQTGVAGANKSKTAAGILGILLGGLGIHRFYLGYTAIGIAQIVVTVITAGFGSLWGFIEGILILCGVSITTDANGYPLV
ncbi:MAG: TM2 domain-containing protein [Armatimonadota bacterium]|jgi:TM2 domain-containing membrane protein YozV